SAGGGTTVPGTGGVTIWNGVGASMPADFLPSGSFLAGSGAGIGSPFGATTTPVPQVLQQSFRWNKPLQKPWKPEKQLCPQPVLQVLQPVLQVLQPVLQPLKQLW